MNGLHDPHNHKRTSITELLNPVAAVSADPNLPASSHLANLPNYANSPQFQDPQMPQQMPMHGRTSSGSFKLSAASWGQSNEEEQALQRKQQEQSSVARSASAGRYEWRAPLDPSLWPSPGANDANLSYNSPSVAPTYSDERTALSGDVTPNPSSSYSMPRSEPMNGYRPDLMHYQPRPPHPSIPQPVQGVYAPSHIAVNPYYYQELAWQQAERAGIRMPGRGAAEPQPIPHMHPHPHPMYPPPPHYYAPHPGMPYGAVAYAHPMAGYLPIPPQKRPVDADAEEENGSKPKRARKSKAGADNAAANGSRRGYNAKKRNEAAQIAAQNAQLVPNVSYSTAGADKGKQKAADGTMRIVTENGPTPPETQGPLHPELQFARCMSNRYKAESFPRCVSCTRRWAGDTCRFQGIRFFLKDDKGNIVGVSFVENQKPDAPSMNFPSRWNVPLDAKYIKRTKRTVAKALLPILRSELEHLEMPEVIRRPRESDVRATCDTCMTSIFSSSWMCRLCGREACAECFDKVRELTQYRPGANEAEMAAVQAKRETHAHSNPFFLSCTRRNEHQYKDFSPMSRFCKAELAQVVQEMGALMAEPESEEALAAPSAGTPVKEDTSSPGADGGTSTSASANGGVNGHTNGVNGTNGTNGTNDTDGYATEKANGNLEGCSGPSDARLSDGFASLAGPAGAPLSDAGHSSKDNEDGRLLDNSNIPCYTAQHIADSELTDDLFRQVWAEGTPFMVTGLLPKFQVQWQPDYFIQKHPVQMATVMDCQSDATKRMSVADFFKIFGNYEGRTQSWKLKDWPSSTDMKTSFPDLYEDFGRAVPMPSYCRRDGALNLASHFPSNTIAPDLGPKMYNAMSTEEKPGSKGSTRLHMDMADAVNIMLHAEPCPDGSPGVAAWDLFRWEDAAQLRKFLNKRFSNGGQAHDPIHSQQIYLDSEMRKELFDDFGIKSYRVYQRPGEAVFIPAGCAHQVCNLADCIKVAIDFVSPENIERCEKLTGEFRMQNQSMAWREDMLQLRTMMWFAWLSCTRQEAGR
ncbi:hypothetical protein EVG20_g7560 [Dentipellis fragilis]|uniref:JmjC domain-containing protein n=1 Tax=Dentipellis fragilis TaxID=205917 RepID=A0A4Y9YBX8_9AGAM|nr:hypothetical protein EVG20_g7560 [Dentipellis fragilis]